MKVVLPENTVEISADIMNSSKSRGVRLSLLGAALIILGELFIIADVVALKPYVFLFCWYGYIFLLDGINHSLKGHSLIIGHSGSFILLLAISSAVWWMYELYNWYVFHGWIYELIEAPKWVEVFLLRIAWATVIPGIVETMQFVEALWERLGGQKLLAESQLEPARKIGKVIPVTLMAAGFLFMGLPWMGVYPYIEKLPSNLVWLLSFFFWGALAMIFDPILYLTGKPSLLGEFEKGRSKILILLFITGYICGFLWEFWNFWAGAKWIYTAQFLQDKMKIFEMPLRGFLDFGPFAVSIYVLYVSFKSMRPLRIKEII